MYNFKKMGGTFKGLAGECMFRLVKTKSYLTRFFPIEFVLNRHQKMLTQKQKEFLINNWLSFDAIEFTKSDIIIYEIKTRNKEYDIKRYKTKFTQNSVDLLNEAKKIGFEVKLAKIFLNTNWEYDIKIFNFIFSKDKMWINNNNKFDKSNPDYKEKNPPTRI